MIVEQLGHAVIEGHLDYRFDRPCVPVSMITVVIRHGSVFVNDNIVVVNLVYEGYIN